MFISAIFANAQSFKVEYQVQFKQKKVPSVGSEDFRKRVAEQQSAKQKHILSYVDGNFMYESFPEAPVYDTVNRPKKIYLTQVPLNSFSQPKIKSLKRKNDPGFYSYTKIKDEEFYQYGIPGDKILETAVSDEKILGLSCKVATVENSISKTISKVWYTEQIPAKTGPLAYFNFPGLVLKVESEHITAEAKSVEKNVKNLIIEDIDKNLKVYNHEEFMEKVKELRKS